MNHHTCFAIGNVFCDTCATPIGRPGWRCCKSINDPDVIRVFHVANPEIQITGRVPSIFASDITAFHIGVVCATSAGSKGCLSGVCSGDTTRWIALRINSSQFELYFNIASNGFKNTSDTAGICC